MCPYIYIYTVNLYIYIHRVDGYRNRFSKTRVYSAFRWAYAYIPCIICVFLSLPPPFLADPAIVSGSDREDLNTIKRPSAHIILRPVYETRRDRFYGPHLKYTPFARLALCRSDRLAVTRFWQTSVEEFVEFTGTGGVFLLLFRLFSFPRLGPIVARDSHIPDTNRPISTVARRRK